MPVTVSKGRQIQIGLRLLFDYGEIELSIHRYRNSSTWRRLSYIPRVTGWEKIGPWSPQPGLLQTAGPHTPPVEETLVRHCENRGCLQGGVSEGCESETRAPIPDTHVQNRVDGPTQERYSSRATKSRSATRGQRRQHHQADRHLGKVRSTGSITWA